MKLNKKLRIMQNISLVKNVVNEMIYMYIEFKTIHQPHHNFVFSPVSPTPECHMYKIVYFVNRFSIGFDPHFKNIKNNYNYKSRYIDR